MAHFSKGAVTGDTIDEVVNRASPHPEAQWHPNLHSRVVLNGHREREREVV